MANKRYGFIAKTTDNKVVGSSNLISKETFFSTEDRAGYFDKASFVEMMNQIKENAPRLFKHYQEFFFYTSEGFNVVDGIKAATNQTNGEKYHAVRFTKGRTTTGAVIIYAEEGLSDFIKDYALNMIKTDFSLEDLIDEASN